MNVLDEKLVEHYRQQLQTSKDELLTLNDVAEDSSKAVELDQSRVGRLSRMDALQSQAMSVELKRRRHIELQRIGTALQRIGSGDYGYCVSCDEEIAPARLDIDPSTLQCIDCAGKAE